MRPARNPIATACARSDAPSLRNSRRACVLTVSSERNRSAPICELDRPVPLRGHRQDARAPAVPQAGRVRPGTGRGDRVARGSHPLTSRTGQASPAYHLRMSDLEPRPAAQDDPFGMIGLTYDDVLLLPGETDVIPSEVDTTTRLTREISVAIPLVSAAMDTVTEARMAIAMARQGGVGVLHRNLSIDDQAHQVDLVKRSESGMITDPVTVGPDATLAELDALCGKYRVSGLPVVDDADRLLGIITNRDLRFVAASDYPTLLVREVMTAQPLVTGPVGISRQDAAS